jgi:hypothetical protein
MSTSFVTHECAEKLLYHWVIQSTDPLGLIVWALGLASIPAAVVTTRLTALSCKSINRLEVSSTRCSRAKLAMSLIDDISNSGEPFNSDTVPTSNIDRRDKYK